MKLRIVDVTAHYYHQPCRWLCTWLCFCICLWLCVSMFDQFLPERDYVTFGSLLSQIRLSVCNVRAPYSGVKLFGSIFSSLCTLAILSLHAKFYGDRPRRTPLRWGRAMVDLSKAISHKRYTRYLQYVLCNVVMCIWCLSYCLWA